jgi:hypothetical protein
MPAVEYPCGARKPVYPDIPDDRRTHLCVLDKGHQSDGETKHRCACHHEWEGTLQKPTEVP